MSDPFDPYREALVIESETIWPVELAGVSVQQRRQLEERLHADAEHACHLEYVRLHAGFCRRIMVAPEDLERVHEKRAVP